MRTKTGIIGSAKMTGTVSVTVDRFIVHPKYNKRFKRSKKYLADTNGHDLFEGDKVEITECRPLSKNKYFKVTTILQAAPRVSEMKDDSAVVQKSSKETSPNKA
jgi:small subunit ribosomal protein S17